MGKVTYPPGLLHYYNTAPSEALAKEGRKRNTVRGIRYTGLKQPVAGSRLPETSNKFFDILEIKELVKLITQESK